MVASLSGSGFVHLGKTGTVSLKEIFITASGQITGSPTTAGWHGYTRIYNTPASHYKRINPWEVGANNAPHPTGSYPPYNLSEWDNYVQWDETQAATDGFDITSLPVPSSATTATATFAWNTGDNAFDEFDSVNDAAVTYTVYYRQCANQDDPGTNFGPCVDSFGDEIEVEWAPQSGSWTAGISNDTSPATINSLNEDKWHVGALVVQWNDEDQGSSFPRQTSPSDTASLTITNTSIARGFPGVGQLPNDPYEYILFKTAQFVCDTATVSIAASGGSPSAWCNACCNTPSSYYRDGPNLTNGTCYYTDSGCTTTATGAYIANGGGPSGNAYPLSAGCISGGSNSCSGCLC